MCVCVVCVWRGGGGQVSLYKTNMCMTTLDSVQCLFVAHLGIPISVVTLLVGRLHAMYGRQESLLHRGVGSLGDVKGTGQQLISLKAELLPMLQERNMIMSITGKGSSKLQN